MGREIQSRTLCDILDQANNSGLVSSISSSFKNHIKKARNILGLTTNSLVNIHSNKLPHSFQNSPMKLMEKGKLKVFSKLKTVYGHLLVEEGLQQPQEVSCLCFDNTGRYVYSGGDDGLIKCWYAMTGQLLNSLKCFHAITDLIISPDNNYIMAGTLIGELRIWSRENLIKICTLSLGSTSINNIKWNYISNELYILACIDQSIYIYSLNDVVEKRDLAAFITFNTPTEVFSLAVDKQGCLAAGLATGKVMFWRLVKSKEENKLSVNYLFDMQENQKKTHLLEWSPIDPLYDH